MAHKQPFPGCEEALEKYYQLRKRLHNYFFNGIQLKITNTQTIGAYSDIYNLIQKNPKMKLENQKKYQTYEQTFFNVFKKDLIFFCQNVKQHLIQKKGTPHPIDQLNFYYQEILNYTCFLRWTHKIMSSIQKNISIFNRTSMLYAGLIILRDQIITPLYPQIFRLIISNIQLFKQGSLQQHTQLQYIIQVVGQCGFTRFFSVQLSKNNMGLFNFVSVSKQTNLIAQIQYQTDFFLRNFTKQYVKYLQNKYNKITNEMIRLSTPQYVAKANQYLKKQQQIADFFYPNKNVKNIIMRSNQQTIITNHCKQLIQNNKTGLANMIQSDNIQAMKNLYYLTKRTSMHKTFGQYYQNCIEKYVGQQILIKLTPDQEKAAKKQTVIHVIDALYQYSKKIQRITNQIQQVHKDPTQLILLTCQTNGFQIACNKSNTICNFLAYYCDTMLKKQPHISDNDNNLKQLIQKLTKLLKFLYSIDQFLKIYQRMLGIRILYDTLKSKQYEFQIINVLKKQVGLGSLSKILTMLQDYKFSQNFNNQNLTPIRNKIPFHFHVELITSGAWQIQDTKNNKKLVPPELAIAVNAFEEQYNQMFPGRKITWLFNYGRAIVQAKFKQQPKTLLLFNNYQLLVVLYLQRRNFSSTKIQQIISQIHPQQQPALLASIMMLVKKLVLKKQGNPLKIQSKNESIIFNFDLKLKTAKLGCFQVPRFIQRLPTANNDLNIQRGLIIQANIVKLMKMKRVLRYQQIIPQVVAMCKNFKADVSMIKNQIENCIYRQFLQRDSKEINTLIYKP